LALFNFGRFYAWPFLFLALKIFGQYYFGPYGMESMMIMLQCLLAEDAVLPGDPLIQPV